MTKETTEPEIWVNGVRLTSEQAMTLRVALAVYQDHLTTVEDPIANLYEEHIREIVRLMFPPWTAKP